MDPTVGKKYLTCVHFYGYLDWHTDQSGVHATFKKTFASVYPLYSIHISVQIGQANSDPGCIHYM